MADRQSSPPEDGPTGEEVSDGAATGDEELTDEQLRRRVEEEYDFDDFGPGDMKRMTAREWEAAFDADSWITGDELLDRVKADLQAAIAGRDVFAVLEEVHEDGERRLLAYSDEGYAVVYPDGGVVGVGTVLRDVKPVVALCSMESYTPSDPPADGEQLLPEPEEVPQGTGEFGNLMLQVVAAVQILAGLGMFGAWVYTALTGSAITVAAAAIGLIFVVVGVFLFATVANARLSDRFRAEEYRERLRAAGLGEGEMPEFVPVENGELVGVDEPPERASLEAVPDESPPGSAGEEPDGRPGEPPE